MGAMKVHQVTRGLIWEHDPASLTLGCKRFRSLAPKLTTSNNTSANSVSSFDLKSFIRPEIGPRKIPEDNKHPPHPPQVESHSGGGGTRWNPTQEQIGVLEMLYKGGTRTPNAQQIEQITAQLGKYGKIEGKNVFYWFQNHKARERQKQKRKSLGLAHSPRSTSTTTRSTTMSLDIRREVGKEEETSPCKRKCRSWTLDNLEFDQEIRIISRDSHDHRGDDRTLELFPLHPEGRKINFG